MFLDVFSQKKNPERLGSMDDLPRKAQQRSIRLQTPRKTPRKTPRSGSLAMAAMNSSMKEHQIGPKWGG
jgi:hypothetical protein